MALQPLTQVEIANMALYNMGITRTISALTDDVVEADILQLHYDNALEDTLEAIDWPFARRRATLVTAAGTPPDPWAYQYDYPADCIRILRIDDGLAIRGGNERIAFAVETTDAGSKLIYTDQSDADILYTFNETDPAKYPSSFSFYFSWILALRALPALIKDEDNATKIEARAQRVMSSAVGKAFDGEQEKPELDAEWIRARGIYDEKQARWPFWPWLP